MKDILLMIVVVGLIFLGYYYWKDHQNSVKITQTREAQCEEIMKSMKFDTADESDNYFIDCLSGKISLPAAGISD